VGQLPAGEPGAAADGGPAAAVEAGEIQPESWPAEYTSELINVLNVLGRLVEVEPAQAELLGRICEGPLVTNEEVEAAGALEEPAVVHAARLTELATRVTEDPIEGASIAGVGLPEGEVPAGRRVDAELGARVRCGRRSVLGVLFGDAYDTLRRELWY